MLLRFWRYSCSARKFFTKVSIAVAYIAHYDWPEDSDLLLPLLKLISDQTNMNGGVQYPFHFAGLFSSIYLPRRCGTFSLCYYEGNWHGCAITGESWCLSRALCQLLPDANKGMVQPHVMGLFSSLSDLLNHLPPPSFLPPLSTSAEKAIDTQFVCISDDPSYKVQFVEIEIGDESFVGMPFVLLSARSWITNKGSDFYVEFGFGSNQVLKAFFC
ncbi:uncharacterized protein LOC130757107 [Actinidia eriantha]|uniref:uncharacterized protein LOC130757107 n=1 Tax=Actinidia eriantha TaxID=165200 RepID=UPI0025845A02|nr:uncharacterized protein LOC130757107 [Actinidia eriantha]